jgi:hypothetical protein
LGALPNRLSKGESRVFPEVVKTTFIQLPPLISASPTSVSAEGRFGEHAMDLF